jgi:hypothetical protein
VQLFVPLDTDALESVIEAVLRKVRTKRRDNIDTARQHLAVANLAGSEPSVFWSVWLVATDAGVGGGAGAAAAVAAAAGAGAAHTSRVVGVGGTSGGGGGVVEDVDAAEAADTCGAVGDGSAAADERGGGGGGGTLVSMQELLDRLIDKCLLQQHPTDMPLGLNV